MMNQVDEDQLARYLLGELDEGEARALDGALGDDAVWEAMQRAEDDVLERYARGGLSAAQRDRLRERLAAAPRLRERLALLDGLRVVATRRLKPQRRAPWVIGGAVACAAVLAIFFAMRGPATVPSSGETVALALLPATRSAAVPTVHIAGHPMLAVSIVLDAEDRYPRYRVRLLHGEAQIWAQDGAVAVDDALALRVPVRLLGDGAYVVEIEGVAADGSISKLGGRGFRVAR